ncbi:acyl-CoA dehydrogenase family protein [Allohahella marinimesophila]|uniref:Acyl-CoA dehydrogenase family protein n=1 Tax=Allohahella marinimesophila TaxID=1054972 RepID=A0ABP7P2N3_9GAMM
MKSEDMTKVQAARPVSSRLAKLQATVVSLTASDIAPRAEEVDRACTWPAHSMAALSKAGLLGLHVPQALGGHEQGLLALSVLTETIAQACPSSALCFGMHCVGSAVIAAKATDLQRTDYLRKIAQGEHITTLALSEAGSGAHFYLPATLMTPCDSHLEVNGQKQFVTNGGHADSYVLSVLDGSSEHHSGDFSCLIVDADTPGLTWSGDWQGFGMRGNSSRAMALDNARVPTTNLLGEPGDQVWYVFEVVAPYFLMAMAGTYLGIAEAALNEAREHLKARRHAHSGTALADHDILQSRLATMWISVERTRSFIREAARKGDLGDPAALPFILASKVDAAETAVAITNEAMTLCGGSAYRENSRLTQMLRDARASHVMSPTTDMLKLWTGRALLDMPLL